MIISIINKSSKDFHQKYPGIKQINMNKIVLGISELIPYLSEEICSNTGLSYILIKEIEHYYHSICLSGNAVLSIELLSLLESDVILGEPDSVNDTEYQAGRTQSIEKSLKGLCNVYKDIDDSKYSSVTSLKESNELEVFLFSLLKYKGEIRMSSIEESIKKAMSDLGITDSSSPLDKEFHAKVPVGTTEVQPAKKLSKTDKVKAAAAKMKLESEESEELENSTVSQSPVNSSEEEPESSIYCKIKDGKMALIIPQDMKMESTEIGGMTVNVITVSIPDLDSTKLQELTSEVVASVEPEATTKLPDDTDTSEIVRVPIFFSKSYPEFDDDVQNQLQELHEKKQVLDDLIKQARADQDENLVNEYRKQRRAIRGKISALTEQV